MSYEEMIAVIQAHKEGKLIQLKLRSEGEDDWKDSSNPGFDFMDYDYRIKPESNYRPFKNADECFAEVKKHGGWIKAKETGNYILPSVISNDRIVIPYDLMFGYLLKSSVWADDGSPCGIKEE